MASQKSSLTLAPQHDLITESPALSPFFWKSVAAAVCGAAIPGVIFYFLF